MDELPEDDLFAAAVSALARCEGTRATALLALGVTHEAKNLLNPLGLQLALLRRRMPPDDRIEEILDAIAATLARGDRMLEAAQRLTHALAPEPPERDDFERVVRALRSRS